jgi:hypothetical protein
MMVIYRQFSIAFGPLYLSAFSSIDQCDVGQRSPKGQSLPNRAFRAMSAFPPIATELGTSLEVRFVPKAEVTPSLRSPNLNFSHSVSYRTRWKRSNDRSQRDLTSDIRCTRLRQLPYDDALSSGLPCRYAKA